MSAATTTITCGLEPEVRVGVATTGSPLGARPNQPDFDHAHHEHHALPRCCQAWIAEQTHGWLPRRKAELPPRS
jgi:hypothetical protein